MSKKHKALIKALETVCEQLETFCDADADFYDQLVVAQIVEEAVRGAIKAGAGHLVPAEQTLYGPREALAVLGRILAWAQDQDSEPPLLISAATVAQMLNRSVRTVWRLASAGEIPAPVKLGGLTQWRRDDIVAHVQLMEASN